MIFVEASETRANTRLPQEVYASATILDGLEAYTGADLLISCIDGPAIHELTLSKPNRIALSKHMAAGVLVQRKSGRDLLNSIPHLSEILVRMQEHATLLPPMLLYTGLFAKAKDSFMAVVDGKETGFDIHALGAALDYWDYRGGKVKHVYTDLLIPRVIDREILPQLQRFLATPTARARRPIVQSLFMTPPQLDWLIQSRTGLGEERAAALLEHTGSLAQALCYLSDAGNLRSNKVSNIGQAAVANMRALLQLPDDMILSVISGDEPQSKGVDFKQALAKHRANNKNRYGS